VVPEAPFELILNGQTSIRSGDTVRLVAPLEHMHCFDPHGLRL
jgi:multiple sugar transport system ATP-binding protein